jgi:hypothetical protein
MGCMVPQPFAAGGNWSYQEFYIVTDDLQYPGYFTPIVTPESSVERWPQPATRWWAEQVLIWYCVHFCMIQRWDYGAKASTISTGNPAVVPTM